jgi:membrane-associated phospholipid phosphatase
VALLCLACGVFADVPLARFVAATSPQARRVVACFSALGDSGYMLVSSALLVGASWIARRRGRPQAINGPMALLGQRGLFVFTTIAVSGLLAQFVKHVVGRARPKLMETMGAFHFDLFSIKASLASFPSGHTASAFGLALALGLIERRLAPLLLALATLVAAARVTLGAHYLSDVVAGAALGSAVTLATAVVMARRGIAFDVVGSRLRLKGDGIVWPALIAYVRRTGPAA